MPESHAPVNSWANDALATARFWIKATRLPGEDACWRWDGNRRHDYGVVRIGGRVYGAHRLAWLLVHGEPIPAVVRHRCDHPWCVNPLHLLGGTQADNIGDMDERRRRRSVGRPGVRHHSAELSEGEVQAIRQAAAAGESQRASAARFGISQPHVSDIVTRKRWRHLP